MTDRISEIKSQTEYTDDDIDYLITRLEAAEKALMFYADSNHWYRFRDFEGEAGAIDHSDWDKQGKYDYCGGMRAREYFKSYDPINGSKDDPND